MVDWYLWLSIGVAAAIIVVIIVLLWAITHRLNRRTGNRGAVQHSRLICPKCGKTFDYEWVVGAALTAVRLGSRRYMACPLCHKWSTFDVYSTILPADPTLPTKP